MSDDTLVEELLLSVVAEAAAVTIPPPLTPRMNDGRGGTEPSATGSRNNDVKKSDAKARTWHSEMALLLRWHGMMEL